MPRDLLTLVCKIYVYKKDPFLNLPYKVHMTHFNIAHQSESQNLATLFSLFSFEISLSSIIFFSFFFFLFLLFIAAN